MRRFLLAVLVVTSCVGEPPDKPGASVAGHRTLTSKRGDRTLAIEVWYPADGSAVATAEPLDSYVVSAADRAAYDGLLAKTPAGCTTRTLSAARDATPTKGPWPLLVFSHCHDCVRFSTASIAAHLASHGFAVAAPDHAGNTLFDNLAGDALPLDATTLRLRADDQKFVLDLLLDAKSADVPEALRGHFDASRVGAFGHSFGAVTTGLVAQEDVRVKAAAALAAPMENVLLPGVSMDKLHVPLLFVVAKEDNSITELGNANIRDNFEHAPGAAWKIEVADAGHWSFSDIAGLRAETMPGCGSSTRQTQSSQTFTYLPEPDGIAIARAWVTAFFEATLLGSKDAKAWLDATPTDARVSVDSTGALE